jgi:hypothetical protein
LSATFTTPLLDALAIPAQRLAVSKKALSPKLTATLDFIRLQ